MPQIGDLPPTDPEAGVDGRVWAPPSAVWTGDDGLARLDPTAPTDTDMTDTATMAVAHRGDGWWCWPPVDDDDPMGVRVEELGTP